MADVNEKNLMVTAEGYVRLIDCDSYQFSHPFGVFRCDVGVPLWTPPELQGKDFRGLLRTSNHDRFGLAVLIFRLLFMGRHPFAGVPDRPVQFEIEKAISEFLFAFTPKTRSLGIRPPPQSLPFSALSNDLAALFERALLRGSERASARPSGREWFNSLDLFSKNIRGCARDPGHKYASHLASCPWCEIIEGGGPNFFYSVVVHVAPQFASSNVAANWNAIQQVSLRPLVIAQRNPGNSPSAAPTPIPPNLAKTRPQFVIGWLIILVSILLFAAIGPAAAIGILVGWVFIAEGSQNKVYAQEVQRRKLLVENLKWDVQRTFAEAERIASDSKHQFSKRKSELQSAYNRFLRFPQEEGEQLAKLEARKRDLQLKEFLDKFFIRDHDIP